MALVSSLYPSVNTFMWPSNDGWHDQYDHSNVGSPIDALSWEDEVAFEPITRYAHQETLRMSPAEEELLARLVVMVDQLTEEREEDYYASARRDAKGKQKLLSGSQVDAKVSQ